MEFSTKELLKEAKIRQYAKIEKLPGFVVLNDHQIPALNRIYTWRVNIAKRTDENPKFVMDDETLVRLAKSNVSTPSDLDEFF